MSRTRRPKWLMGLGVLAVIVLLSLGVWQLQRLQWKNALIERVDTGLLAEPVPAPGPQEWVTVTFDGSEYRRITVRGRYLPVEDTLVKAVTARGSGFWVLSAFETDEGWRLYVNRGFVPDDRRSAEERSKAVGEREISGLLRLTQPGGAFLRDNDPVGDRWFSRDTKAMASARGIGEVAPYFLDADASEQGEQLPIGGLTVVSFPNKHFGYAMTWFALAAILAYLLYRGMRMPHSPR